MFLSELKSLQLKGRDQPHGRQVGAWQSKKITAYSVVKNAVKFAKARLSIPSAQDYLLLKQSKELIDLFEQDVITFKEQWKAEITALNTP
jgi:hypothetical protein